MKTIYTILDREDRIKALMDKTGQTREEVIATIKATVDALNADAEESPADFHFVNRWGDLNGGHPSESD